MKRHQTISAAESPVLWLVRAGTVPWRCFWRFYLGFGFCVFGGEVFLENVSEFLWVDEDWRVVTALRLCSCLLPSGVLLLACEWARLLTEKVHVGVESVTCASDLYLAF